MQPTLIPDVLPQRRFGLDNLNLLNTETLADEPDEAGAYGGESDSGSAQRKRKRTTKVGRIPHGEDFWGQVDSYLAEKVKELGRDLAGQQWRE